jgi:cell division transport system permease protein
MYAIRQALRAIQTNWIASVATMTTMTLCLTILAGFSLVILNLNRVLEDLQNELEITAFLSEDMDAQTLYEDIGSTWTEVDHVNLISKEAGFESLMEDIPELRNSAQLVGNPLPDRIDIVLYDPLTAPTVVARLRAAGVEDIVDGSEAIERFLAINDSVRVLGFILIVILLVSALFAIVNSIRAAITARKNEIDVMRLVGATRGFIRSPFLVEGFLLGLFSALITLALVIPGYNYATMRLTQGFGFIPFERDIFVLGRVGLLLFALALLVGLVGSAISVSQHLREER